MNRPNLSDFSTGLLAASKDPETAGRQLGKGGRVAVLDRSVAMSGDELAAIVASGGLLAE